MQGNSFTFNRPKKVFLDKNCNKYILNSFKHLKVKKLKLISMRRLLLLSTSPGAGTQFARSNGVKTPLVQIAVDKPRRI